MLRPILSGQIHEPSGVCRPRWPVSVGVPFEESALRSVDEIRLLGPDGQALASCAEVRATWPDGSVKWALLDFQIDVEPMARTQCTLALADPDDRPETHSPLHAEVSDEYIDVFTGDLAVRLGRCGPRLLRSVSQGPCEFLRPADDGDGPSSASADLVARDADGTLYWGAVEEAVLEEHNALRLVIRASGGYIRQDGSRLLSWIARVCFFAHHRFLRIHHTIVHDQPAEWVHLRQLRFALPLDLSRPRRAILSLREPPWDHGPVIDPLDAPVTLVQWNPERVALLRGEDSSPGRTDHRVNADGWIHLGDARANVTVKLRHPWQSYPKAYGTDGQSLFLDLYPDLEDQGLRDADSGHTYTQLDRAPHVEHDRPLRIPQGMARTHELYLRFDTSPQAGEACSPQAVDAFALAVEQPLLYQLPSEYYAETGALGPFQPFKPHFWPLELKLRQFSRPPNGLGVLNYGDQVKLEIGEGRVQTRTTENLAYELPRSLLRQYLRSGDQRLFWEGEAAVQHLMDVDTVHFSASHPEWVGGPYFEWSQNHHYTDTSETELTGPKTSHTWLGSLLDYYFLTGYRRAREVAEACADYCRRAAPYDWKSDLTKEARERVLQPGQSWPFSTRTVGWALTAMGTFYGSFPEPRFLPAMEALVDLLEAWQDDEGRWRDQIGSHNRGETPFMVSSVLQGLQHYHAASGDQRAQRMLVKGVSFLARGGRTADGIFYYKEGPISDNPHASTAMLLGPLAHAYEETGDPDILEAGYRLLRWLIDGDHVATYMLKDLFAFLPLLDRHGLLDGYRDLGAQDCFARLRTPRESQRSGRG